MFAHRFTVILVPSEHDSKFSPTYLKIRTKEKLCWKKGPLSSFHKPACPFVSARFLVVAHVERKKQM